MSGFPDRISNNYELPSIAVTEDTDNMVPSTTPKSSPRSRISVTKSSQNWMSSGDILEPSIGGSTAGISDRYFCSRDHIDSLWPVQAVDPLLQGSDKSSEHEWVNKSTAIRPSASPAQIDRIETSKSDGDNLKAYKGKARGKFTDTRRREVQEIRKQGACIRCRMLKKPVSIREPLRLGIVER